MDDLPVIVRPKGPQKASEEEKQEFADIFKSDDEDSDDEMRYFITSNRLTTGLTVGCMYVECSVLRVVLNEV
jgi:hypothetical protein